MKELLILISILVLALTGCRNANVSINSETSLAETAPPETTIDADISETAEYSILCDCGEHYVHEDLRTTTPPLNIREPWEWGVTQQQFQESLYQFETIHRITYHQFETEWHGYSFVIWTDEPLRDFFFASLDVAGHYWNDDSQLVIGTQEVLYEIDALLLGDAVVFNVSFSHYLLPHAGIGFADSNGVHRRMFISESMRGGCWPSVLLVPLEDSGWAVWR